MNETACTVSKSDVSQSRFAGAHELSHHVLQAFDGVAGGRVSTWADYQDLTLVLRRRWQDERQHALETLSRAAERRIASLQPAQAVVFDIPDLGTSNRFSSSADAVRLIKWLKRLALVDQVPAGVDLAPDSATRRHDLVWSGGSADAEIVWEMKAGPEPTLTLATALWVVLVLLPYLVGACLRIFRDGLIQRATAPSRLIRNSARNLRGPDFASWTLYLLACGAVIV